MRVNVFVQYLRYSLRFKKDGEFLLLCLEINAHIFMYVVLCLCVFVSLSMYVDVLAFFRFCMGVRL